MANAAAMIARDGVLMRPRLIAPGPEGALPEMKPGAWQSVPDRVDLHLPPAALIAAKDGMFRVVNSKSGTGTSIAAGDKLLQSAMICGKTGSAQAARFTIEVRDAVGTAIKDENGRTILKYPDPSTPENPNPLARWYRATIDDDGKLNLKHSWYIGFAPADKPQVAFAVMVEYGGSGGTAAASVARESLEACIERGYLKVKSAPQEANGAQEKAGQ
jgi:cell division protein FtsI/penicillin-binding protein 2